MLGQVLLSRISFIPFLLKQTLLGNRSLFDHEWRGGGLPSFFLFHLPRLVFLVVVGLFHLSVKADAIRQPFSSGQLNKRTHGDGPVVDVFLFFLFVMINFSFVYFF